LTSGGLIAAIRPTLTSYALAHPNFRSSHVAPTPQGAGIGVVLATLAVTWGIVLLAGPPFEGEITRWTAVTLGALLLTLIGALVDIRGVSLTIRLVLQGAAVAAVIATLPADLQFVPMLPWWLERAALLVGGVWFINLVNFMDGIDWMTV